jgi:alkylated DNA repair dioxygenase AlkB
MNVTIEHLSQLELGTSVSETCGSLYIPDYGHPGASDLGHDLDTIKEELLALPWVTKRTARHEYFMSEVPREYSYGNKGLGDETYQSQPFSPCVAHLGQHLNRDFGTEFNVCFLNKYDDQHQHLGWHADDFPGMRSDQPIIVASFGAAREIWVKDKRGFPCECQNSAAVSEFGIPPCSRCGGAGWLKSPPDGKQPANHRILLEEGSVFIMPPGYQDTHLHRIPKHDRPFEKIVSPQTPETHTR